MQGQLLHVIVGPQRPGEIEYALTTDQRQRSERIGPGLSLLKRPIHECDLLFLEQGGFDRALYISD